MDGLAMALWALWHTDCPDLEFSCAEASLVRQKNRT